MVLHMQERDFVADSDEPPLLTPPTYLWAANTRQHEKNQREKLYADKRTATFRKKHYPTINIERWNDWHWQMANRIRTLDEIARFLRLTDQELLALHGNNSQLPFAVTPYYLSTVNLEDADDPIRRTIIPVIQEQITGVGESSDPLHEGSDSPVPGIVHRYPDRVLFLVTNHCAVYCRYCTRSRLVGGHVGSPREHWERAIEYIRSRSEVRDVLISGGDPLTLPDGDIAWLLNEIGAIPHVEMIRIGTKVPVVMPMRITPSLIKILRKQRPLYMSIHMTHPNEMTPAVAKACETLADNGIVLGSQTVLLKGVNDCVETLRLLYHRLLLVRVRPYYLYQCDPISGSEHFRTTVEKGKEMIRGLRGFTSGYAVPQYIIDSPGGGGKIPILPDYYVGHDENQIYLRNYENVIFTYPERRTDGAFKNLEHVVDGVELCSTPSDLNMFSDPVPTTFGVEVPCSSD